MSRFLDKPAPPGRPTRSKDGAAKQIVSVRFTRREDRELNRRRKKLGVPLATMVRDAALRSLPRKAREALLEPKRDPQRAAIVALVDRLDETLVPALKITLDNLIAIYEQNNTDDDDEGDPK